MACAPGLLLILLASWAAVGADLQCSAQNDAKLQFAIISKVEESRQRVIKVDITDESQQPDQLSLSVDHWTKVCGMRESVTLSVVVTTPVTKVKPNTTIPAQSVKSAVPPGYMLIPGVGYYKLNKTTVVWEEGRQTCEADGGIMAIPDSHSELQALTERLRSLNINKAPWLGVRRENGKWRTLQGSSFGGAYIHWRKGYPTTQGDCLYLNVDGIGNAPCSLLSNFICEKQLPQILHSYKH